MKILFVCTGNTCRSPMAEGYVNSLKLKDITAISAGFGFTGDPVSQNSVLAMAEMGVGISEHRSRTVNPYLVNEADKIVCMSETHKQTLLSFGADGDKIEVLGISDPFGRDLSVYRECAKQIVNGINQLLGIAPVKVVVATEQDIPTIAEIEKERFSQPWSENSISSAMNNNTIFFLAKKNGKSVGYVGLSVVADEGYITNIATLKEAEKQGVATALLTKVCEYCVQKELAFFSLEVRKSNTPAIKLYKRFLMEKVGERKNFYQNPKEDALIFTRRF